MSAAGRHGNRNGGRLVVESLLAHGIDTLYCVPGESYLPVLDAVHDIPAQLRLIVCRHEGGAAMMAAAGAQLTGEPGVCFVTRAPGATNASLAVQIAREASIPLLLLVGQVQRARLGHQSFQEMDYLRFFGSVAKRVVQLEQPDAIPAVMADAFCEAMDGRPGPLVLVFPEDVLDAEAAASSIAPRTPGFPAAAVRELETLERRLAEAERPLIIAGGGSWTDRSGRGLEDFAARRRIPVVTAFRRQDLIDNAHPVYAGYLGLRTSAELWSLVEEADCILVLGARLDEPTTRGYTAFRNRGRRDLIHVYPGDAEIGLNYPPDLAIRAEVNAVMAQLAALPAGAVSDRRAAWQQRLRDSWVHACEPPTSDAPLDPGRIMGTLNDRIPEDALIAIDAGDFTLWPQRYRTYKRPGRLLAPVNGAMGYGVPAAIAAALTCPGQTVVGLVGDGGMLMTGMELATAAKYGARVIILVFNNDAYGTIDTHQRRRFPGRRIGVALHNPDFAALARSFGLYGARVDRDDTFADALDEALHSSTGAVIELVLGR